jgi:hypothetical protein
MAGVAKNIGKKARKVADNSLGVLMLISLLVGYA